MLKLKGNHMLTDTHTGRNTHAPKDRSPLTHNGRVVGWWDDQTLVFTKRVLAHHIIKKFNAVAYDVALVDELARLGCRMLEVTRPDAGSVYRVAFAVLRAEGIPFDYGHGAQVALPLSFWTVTRRPVAATRQQEPTRTQPAGWAQAALWEVGA